MTHLPQRPTQKVAQQMNIGPQPPLLRFPILPLLSTRVGIHRLPHASHVTTRTHTKMRRPHAHNNTGPSRSRDELSTHPRYAVSFLTTFLSLSLPLSLPPSLPPSLLFQQLINCMASY